MQDDAPPKPRRRRVRLTLGAMMLLVLAIAGPLGWIAHRARVQREAVAAILRDKRGGVYYDWQYRNGKSIPNGTPRGPKWLRSALGHDVFDTVTMVGLRGERLDDALMGEVAKLTQIETLNIQGGPAPGLAPAGMARIRSLAKLEKLIVQGLADPRGFIDGLEGKSRLRMLLLQSARATDADLAILGRLTQLEELTLDGRNVTDAGFARVAPLKKLVRLELRGATITDLSPVADLTGLDRLVIGGSPLSYVPGPERPVRGGPISLEPLRRLTKLRALHLGPTRASDRDLAVLLRCPGLLALHIGGPGITDEGLATLAQLGSLNSLGLTHTRVRDLRPLGPMLPRLVLLQLYDSPVTDAGLAPISAAARLRNLAISGSNITEAALGPIAGLPGLNSLQLGSGSLTDAGVARLRGLGRLGGLGLYDAPITDAAIPDLASFPGLRSLILHRTQISPEGIGRLKAARPRLLIITERPPES